MLLFAGHVLGGGDPGVLEHVRPGHGAPQPAGVARQLPGIVASSNKHIFQLYKCKVIKKGVSKNYNSTVFSLKKATSRHCCQLQKKSIFFSYISVQ
jgi:hypothetical protein